MSAHICLSDEAEEHEALAAAVWSGSTWTAPGDAQVPSLRFRVRGDRNIEVLVQDWGSELVVPGEHNVYEATLRRRDARGESEVLNLRFRFAGGGVTSWIELESWYHSLAVRTGNGEPCYALDTLFPRPD